MLRAAYRRWRHRSITVGIALLPLLLLVIPCWLLILIFRIIRFLFVSILRLLRHSAIFRFCEAAWNRFFDRIFYRELWRGSMASLDPIDLLGRGTRLARWLPVLIAIEWIVLIAFGLGISAQLLIPGISQRFATVYLSLLVPLAFGPLLVMAFQARLDDTIKRWKRSTNWLCPACGYIRDVAGRNRCPECGTARPALQPGQTPADWRYAEEVGRIATLPGPILVCGGALIGWISRHSPAWMTGSIVLSLTISLATMAALHFIPSDKDRRLTMS